jgi:hypothetical protein
MATYDFGLPPLITDDLHFQDLQPTNLEDHDQDQDYDFYGMRINPENSHPLPNDYHIRDFAYTDGAHLQLHNGPRTLPLPSRYVVTEWTIFDSIYRVVDVFICFNLDDALSRFNDLTDSNYYLSHDNDFHQRHSFSSLDDFSNFRNAYFRSFQPESFIASIQISTIFTPYFNEIRFVPYNGTQFGVSIQLLN